MADIETSAETVVVRSLMGRRQTFYYPEIAKVEADGHNLVLRLHDGRSVSARIGSARAGTLARQIDAVIDGVDDALAGVTGLSGLRREVGAWIGRVGFSASPFVEFLLRASSELEASDLHLEPGQDGGYRLWLRLDGVLHDVGDLPQRIGKRTVGRLKVISGVKAHRDDIPQEGRASTTEGGWARMSFVPSVVGETATVRLFDRLKGRATLDELGLGEQARERLRRVLSEPRGILVLAGPSASGKSTTMYTCLKMVTADSKSTLRAITVEDPVEYRLDGVVQLEADPERGNTGPLLLRSVLRQDADLLAVGEVRDTETAKLVMEAGLTGHRVLSTVHAGSAAEAMLRLLELGTKPEVLASAVVAVLAQRLLRKLCPECDGEGCKGCIDTGYRGRTAVAEVMLVDEGLRRVLETSPDLDALEQAARKGGMKPMTEEASHLVSLGVTNQGELERELGRGKEA